MKRIFKNVSLGLILMMFFGSYSVTGQTIKRSSGMVLRGSFWHNDGEYSLVSVTSGWGSESVRVGHGGGWLVFFSRTSDRMFLELSLGATGQVIVNSDFSPEEEVEVDGVIPVVMGIKYQVMPVTYQNVLEPYVSFGGGPYWLSNIHVVDQVMEEEVVIDTQVKPGLYFGGGFDFMLGSWFGINLDIKYHFVNFDLNHDKSGLDFGLGLCFKWGRFNPVR